MNYLFEKEYLMAPDNEAKRVSACCCCAEGIFAGEEYYDIYDEHYCKDCADFQFKKIAGDQ